MYADLYEMDFIFKKYEAGCQCLARTYAGIIEAREPEADEWVGFVPYIPPTCPTDDRDPAFTLALLGAGGPL